MSDSPSAPHREMLSCGLCGLHEGEARTMGVSQCARAVEGAIGSAVRPTMRLSGVGMGVGVGLGVGVGVGGWVYKGCAHASRAQGGTMGAQGRR